ncbi:uncharacterized protein LOC121853920 [Homarus americanus]|nr:uncharacterized protein LOC121853920 [Homarus americanus]
MEMKVPLRLYTWHHLCVSADMTKDTQYMIFDGVVHEALIRRPSVTREKLTKVRGGGRFLLGQNYNPASDLLFSEAMHGDLADFRFYDVALPTEHLRDYVACMPRGDLVSPLYYFDTNMTNLQLSGDIKLDDISLDDLCSSSPDLVMILPEKITFDQSVTMCSYFTGGVAVPTGEEENAAIYDKFEDFNNYCANSWGTTFWYGLRANLSSGWWIKISDGKPLTWDKFIVSWANPTEEYRCVSAAAINVKHLWAASPCDIRQCPICNFTTTPKLHLRGLCKLSKFDRYFSPHDYYSWKPVFEGFFLSRIIWENDTWVIKSRLEKKVKALMAIKKLGDYPFGLNTWEVRDDTCAQKQVQLLFTSCGRDDFTCSDGTCINKTKRCDQQVDCPDNTDELNCEVITFPEGYSPELAPPAVNAPLMTLQVSLEITSIRNFDLVGFNLAIDIIQNIKWKDARLILRNLRPGGFINVAKLNERLWEPEILVSDGSNSPTDIHMRGVKLVVKRDSEPLPDNDVHYSEDELYSGAGNWVMLVHQYTVTAMCQFQLQAYPFDTQMCSLMFSVPDQSVGNILLLQEGVSFSGVRRLLEYQLVNETLAIYDQESSALQLRLVFKNQYGYYIGNAVIPSLLMAFICYLTFYFDMEDFSDRIMVSLTSLLVLASLFTQTSQSIPKTAYLKLIDIWYVTLITTDFFIIVILVIIENQRMREKTQGDSITAGSRNLTKVIPAESRTLPTGSNVMINTFTPQKQRTSTAKRLNRASQVMFPVVASIGCFGWIFNHLQGISSSHTD